MNQDAFNKAQRNYDAQEHPSYWRKELPEAEPLSDSEAFGLVYSTLENVRDLAWLEVVNGSKAWEKAVSLMDEVLDETAKRKPTPNEHLINLIRQT